MILMLDSNKQVSSAEDWAAQLKWMDEQLASAPAGAWKICCAHHTLFSNGAHGDNGVLQWFIKTYGTTVLTVPTNRGFSRMAWIMPYLALVVGIALVVFIVLAWKKRPLVVHGSVPAAVRGAELDRFRDQARRETEI